MINGNSTSSCCEEVDIRRSLLLEVKMAQKGVQLESIFCSICQDTLTDPVTIPCGHSYCMNCIKVHWNLEDQKKLFSCPQCRKTFMRRPDLVKSTMLADLVEQLKKTGLQKNICSRHNEEMKIFCRSDQQIICYLCSMDEHKGHDTVSAIAERTERQRELEGSRHNIQQRIQDRQKELKLLQQEVEDISRSADKTVEDSQEIFTQLIRVMEQRRRDVEQQVRSQQEAEVSRVKELEKKLEQEIRELKRKDAELKKLSDTEDHSQFLQDYPSLSGLSGSTHSSSINIRPLRHFEDMSAAVSKLRDQLQELLRDTWSNISVAVTEPKTRADFLKYSRKITLDPNTVHRYLILSEGNRKVTRTSQQQSYPDHPDRFTDRRQVLSRESLTGRCYWELEWSGTSVRVGVAYKYFCKAGSENYFGFNDKSWALMCDADRFTVRHNGKQTPASGPWSYRIGVYLDHKAGLLSFYSISGTMTLLHRVQTTFTQPLHVGLRLYPENSAELCKL